MNNAWTIGAQLSTSHYSPGSLNLSRISPVVERVASILKLDILIVGDRELPEVFRAMTEASSRPAKEVFLWYNLLSDIGDMHNSDLVVNWRGEQSHGWGGWAEKGADVSETFRFACPNNPAVRKKTVGRLRQVLSGYSFDGVFLDKLRFPSPANGLDEVLSCFCPHCRQAATAAGLDLDEVARVFEGIVLSEPTGRLGEGANGAAWLDALAEANLPISEFLNFRRNSITSIVAAAHAEALQLGRKVALDLFSPGLAGLVGQDYRALSKYCVWAKPMTYRVARGPAGLRLEIPALVEDIARKFGLDEAAIAGWASRYIPGFDLKSLQTTRESAVPLPIISAEISDAVRLMHPAPVYFGLEIVRHPGVIDITPALVNDMVEAGHQGRAAGAIVSWDLMHAPIDGLEALARAI